MFGNVVGKQCMQLNFVNICECSGQEIYRNKMCECSGQEIYGNKICECSGQEIRFVNILGKKYMEIRFVNVCECSGQVNVVGIQCMEMNIYECSGQEICGNKIFDDCAWLQTS